MQGPHSRVHESVQQRLGGVEPCVHRDPSHSLIRCSLVLTSSFHAAELFLGEEEAKPKKHPHLLTPSHT